MSILEFVQLESITIIRASLVASLLRNFAIPIEEEQGEKS